MVVNEFTKQFSCLVVSITGDDFAEAVSPWPSLARDKCLWFLQQIVSDPLAEKGESIASISHNIYPGLA